MRRVSRGVGASGSIMTIEGGEEVRRAGIEIYQVSVLCCDGSVLIRDHLSEKVDLYRALFKIDQHYLFDVVEMACFVGEETVAKRGVRNPDLALSIGAKFGGVMSLCD